MPARVGADVPATFDGAVIGVFRTACTIALDPVRRDVRVVALTAGGVPMTAVSATLPSEEFDAVAALHAGDVARCRDRVLSVGGLRVSLEGARYTGEPSATAEGCPPALVADAAARLCELATARYARPGMSGNEPFRRAVAERLALLSSAVAAIDTASARAAAESLVGLGPGLTPAGDDALCGFLLGRRLLGGQSRAEEALREVTADAWGRTPDISAQHLSLASRGRFGEALLSVGEALGARDRSGVEAAALWCLRQGATSGADALFGLTAALRITVDGGVAIAREAG